MSKHIQIETANQIVPVQGIETPRWRVPTIEIELKNRKSKSNKTKN